VTVRQTQQSCAIEIQSELLCEYEGSGGKNIDYGALVLLYRF